MRHSRKDRTLSILLVLPSVIAMFIFIYGFIGFTAYSSLSNWNKLTPDFTFVGLDNYTRLFKNQRFIIDMQNTFTFTLLFLIVTIVLGFLLGSRSRSKYKRRIILP